MKNNLILIVVCVIFAHHQVLGDDKEQSLKEMLEAVQMCKEKVKAPDAEVELFKQMKEPTTMEGKCLHACLMKHFKVMDANGKFAKSVALEHVKQLINGDAATMEKAEKLGSACEHIDVPADECEASAVYIKCFIENAKKLDIENIFFS